MEEKNKYQEALDNAVHDIDYKYHDFGEYIPKERLDEIKLFITDSYKIEESILDKAINKAQKMLSDKCNVDINDDFVDGVEMFLLMVLN